MSTIILAWCTIATAGLETIMAKGKPIPRSWYPGPLLYEGVREIAHQGRTKMNSVIRRAVLLYFIAQPEFESEFTGYLTQQAGLTKAKAKGVFEQLRETLEAMEATDLTALARLAGKLRTVLEEQKVAPEVIDQVVQDVVGPLEAE